MIGLKSGTVKLVQHQEEWHENAENVISVLKQLLGDTALDIQHVGSTAICSIHAKPIIDIAVAVHDINCLLGIRVALVAGLNPTSHDTS